MQVTLGNPEGIQSGAVFEIKPPMTEASQTGKGRVRSQT
jgi:hypothetical protein